MWSVLLLMTAVAAQTPVVTPPDLTPWHVVEPAPGHPRKALVVTSTGRAVPMGEGLRNIKHTPPLGDRVRSAEAVLGMVGVWAARVGIVGLACAMVVAGAGVTVAGVVMVLINGGLLARPAALGSGADFVIQQAPGWVGGGLVAIATALLMVGVVVVLEVWHELRGPRPPDPDVLAETAASVLWDPDEAHHVVREHNQQPGVTP